MSPIYFQKCPLSTAPFFILVSPHSLVSERQPAVTGASALGPHGTACTSGSSQSPSMTLEKSSSISVPQFLYKMQLGEYLLYGVVVKSKSRCQAEPLQLGNQPQLNRRVTGSSAGGQRGRGLGKTHKHCSQKKPCVARGLRVGKKELEDCILQVEFCLSVKVGGEPRQLKEERLEERRLLIIMSSFEPL